ncbi:hypothetical protein Poli38472_009010 [Pythium oligandrum]|uniref:Condensin-2 complex subunit G2 n=1 Tax=Pythium oligandrum TaxID=41045 RepID=A0A8K1FNP8_PYTOL|nr:hypothetical protein Poli38472_009010 [Pythium oligandrum]|eukprot:TMW64843.1 hypothetical protein Poli38472_009010 [Pythium oligandrum]
MPKTTVATALRAFASERDATPLALVLETRRQEQRRAKGKKQPSQDALEGVDEQLRSLPRATLHGFCDAANTLLDEQLSVDDALGDEMLQVMDVVAQFTTLLVSHAKRVTVDTDRVFDIAQTLHDHLLRLRGDAALVHSVQDTIALLCEACWKNNYNESAQSLITQLLPYLIVRSYEAQANDAFQSKRHPIRRLFSIKDALLLLDFDDESSGLLRDILLRCFIQPNFFRSPDAVAFLGFLFELHLPFITDINATIRNQIPNQRKSILKKFGAIYFKAWVGSTDDFRAHIEEECIQRYVRDAVHASSLTLFTAVRTVLQIFFENKRHAGVDEMLYRITSPILWRGVKAANDSVRRQAAILLFDNFPLRDPQFNNEMMDRALQKQFDAFEELLADSHPAVRIAGIQGVSKVLSIYWELLPAETIRCFISRLCVDLVNDASSSAVRAAVFEGVQFILDNHHSHSILKPLLPMLAPLINDRNERVRAEFAALLVRIKSIRNLHFYDVVSVNDLLDRLVLDRDCPIVRKQLILLFLNSYFPQSVGGSSQVARCLALVKKNPEAAMVFYGNVADQASVGSVCKLAALLCRCSLNFVSKRLNRPQGDDDEEEEEQEEEEEGFSIVGRIVVLEIMASLLKSVHVKVLNDERYLECKTFLTQQLSSEALEALLAAYSEGRPFDQEALSAVWKIIGFLGELTQGEMLEPLVSRLMAMDETSSKKLLDSMVECLTKWHQLPFLVTKIENVLMQWTEAEYVDTWSSKKDDKSKKTPKKTFALNAIVALSTAEYIVQSPSVPCPKHLTDRLVVTLKRCVDPLLSYSSSEVKQLCTKNAFGVVRLIEVYAKVLMIAESTHVSQQTSALLESSTVKQAMANSETLQTLQPAAFFTPPVALADLLEWIARMLMELHGESEPSEDTGGNKKRRRGGTAADGEHLLSRWRNLFSLVALLVTECIAFVFQREGEYTSEISDFIDRIVCSLSDAAQDMPTLDRAIVFHTCQLLSLLEKEKQKPTRVATSEAWTHMLQRALEAMHERFEDACKELLAPVRSLLDLSLEDQGGEQSAAA